MKLQQETYSDRNGYYKLHVLTGTKITDVDSTGAATLKALAELRPIEREWSAAQGDPERIAAEATAAAQEAGRTGAKFDKAAWKKKKRDAIEHLEDVTLDRETAWSKIAHNNASHLEAIERHATALAQTADAEAALALTSLAAASRMAQTGVAQLDPALTVRAAVERLLDGDGFIPVPPRAPGEFGMSGAPSPYVQIAIENIGTAMGYASDIIERLKADGKVRAKARDMEREADESAELGDQDDDDTDEES